MSICIKQSHEYLSNQHCIHGPKEKPIVRKQGEDETRKLTCLGVREVFSEQGMDVEAAKGIARWVEGSSSLCE